MAAIDVPAKVATQIQEAVEQYRKPLRDALARNATEGDTGLMVSRMLTDVFGYDPFDEVTSEFKIKGQFVDFAIREQGRISLVIEVKSIGTKLSAQNLFQATSYAAHEGVEWAVLTNGAQWNLYRITFTKPVEWHLVLTVDFVEERPSVNDLVLFHKWGMKKGLAELEWQKLHALSPANMVKALLSDETLRPISAFIKKSTGMRFAIEELRERLVEDVLRPGLVGTVGLAELPGSPVTEGKTEVRRVRLKSLVDAGLVIDGEAITGECEGMQAVAAFQADGSILFAEQRFTNLYALSEAVFGRSLGYACWDAWRRPTGETLADVRDQYLAR